jgi:hypothetical protein
MKINYLQHVPFEDVAYMGNWAKENGIHQIESLNTNMVKLMNFIILGSS